MAESLPYYRHTPQEWQNGNISFEPFETQGLFINVCNLYWVRDCVLTQAQLKQRLGYACDLLDRLFEINVISINSDGFVKIKFLDRQFDILSQQRINKQKAGKKGGKAKKKPSTAKAQLKHSPSNKIIEEKDKDKDNITTVAKKPRKRNLQIDALAELEGNLSEATSATFSKCAKALKIIKEVAPNVTAEEIRRRADNYRTHFEGVIISSTALSNNWARCAQSGGKVSDTTQKQRDATKLAERSKKWDLDHGKVGG